MSLTSGGGFVQFDRIAVGIGDLYLLAAGAYHDVAADRDTAGAQTVDLCVKIVNVEHDPVPSAGLLALAVHRS